MSTDRDKTKSQPLPAASGAEVHLKQLQQRCREDATRIQQGRFRLDWERALDKIKDFQLADPHRYVLEVVQAAVAGGATAIEVQIDSDDVILGFDGRQYTDLELERLFDYLFTREPELEPLRQLALGVNAALGLKPRFVVVDSGDGQQGFRLRLSNHADVEVSPLPPDQILDGTRVHVRDRISFKVLSRAMGEAVEADLMRQACCHLPVPLLLGGQDMRQPLEPGLAAHSFDATGIKGELALPQTLNDLPQISVLMNGVQVCLLDDDSARRVGLPVQGFVDNPALTRNASHSGIHDNEELKRTVSRLRMEARKLLRAWLREVLPLDPQDRQAALREREFSETEANLLQRASRWLLRASRKTDLPPELDALLDLPDMVRLAIKEPPRVSLRPIWEIYREHGQYHACGMVHDLARDDLPPHLLPVLGPMNLLLKVFGKPQPADDVLRQIATREYNRRQRQKNPMEAALPHGVALVKVALDDPGRGLCGEVGLCEPEAQRTVEAALVNLALRHGEVDQGDGGSDRKPVVHVTFLQQGVLLGQRRLTAPGFWGVAILDSPDFEPNQTWDNLLPNAAFKSVHGALVQAVPGLLRQLQEAFSLLPPPPSLLAAGSWEAAASDKSHRFFSPGLSWPTDVSSRRGRQHADRLLATHQRLDREAAPWLYAWPLFFSLQGEALTLDQLLARRQEVRYVVDVPWGEAPEDMLLVNISAQQKRVLQRYLPGKLVSGKRRLNRWRKGQVQAAERRQAYERNFSRAELFRQQPRLEKRNYLAVMDLTLPEGEGQVGIPGTPSASHIRYLVHGVPLVDEPLKISMPLHAVVQSARVQPNEDFSAVGGKSATKEISRLVKGAVPALVDALAASPTGRTRVGAEAIWRFLEKARTSAARPLEDLPPSVVDLPLLPTVAHGLRSLREVRDEALQHDHKLLFTTTEATRQLSERPILRGDKRSMKLLRRLLHVHSKNFDLPLGGEQQALTRLDQPRQAARLQGATWLEVEVTGEQISGKLGYPQDALWKIQAGPPVSEVKVLREGVQLCRRPVDLLGMRALGVVECPRLTPTDAYSNIAEDFVWLEVTQALRDAARDLALETCRCLSEDRPGQARETMVAALQLVAGRLFGGRPELDLDEGDQLRREVAQAPIWPSAGEGHAPYTLVQLAEACRGPAVLWVVGASTGHLQPGRVIVHAPGEQTRIALRLIFGDEVQDGAKVLRRDNAAHVRYQAAPALAGELPVNEALLPVEIHREQPGLLLRGQVAVWRDYERAPAKQLLLRIGLDGRKLCERTVPHALRGVCQVDGRGLTPKRDWTGLADQRQRQLLEWLASEALWESADQVVQRALRPGRRLLGRGAERLLMLELLTARAGKADVELLEAPLFSTVHGQQLSAARLRQLATDQGQVLVVSDELGQGVPADGSTIVRAGPTAMAALERLLEGALQRHDDLWKDDLAGQARRQETPQSAPQVSEGALEQVYFCVGASSGLAGLLPLSGDQARSHSLVRLHVGNRRVATRKPPWKPAVDVWINNDRLQPTLDFRDVEQDEAYGQVMEVAEAQVPELLACAASLLIHQRHADQGEELARWLRVHVMEQLERLQEEAAQTPLGPAARILRAALWRCLTSGGPRWIDTAELLAASGVDQLALVPADAKGSPSDQAMVLVPATAAESAALQQTLGELPDHGHRLRSDEAHRVFLWRRQLPSVNLEEAGVDPQQQVLWHHGLDHAGWEGELGLLPDPGQQITVTLFWEHRRLALLQLPCLVQAVCAVECSLLSVNADYSQVLTDEAYEAWVASLQAEVAIMLSRAAAALPDQPERIRRRLRPVLLGALVLLDARRDPVSRKLADRLIRAPLLLDHGGQALSVATAVEAQEGPVAVIAPQTAARGRSLGQRLVLVLPRQDRTFLGELMKLEPYDEVYLRGVEARRRRDRAPDTADVSWFRTVARGEAVSQHLRGELALKPSQPPGRLWLMSEGRVVEERVFPQTIIG